MKLLVVSNGHGEDVIAVRIIEQLKLAINDLEIFALPLVGEGHSYQRKQISIIGEVKQMPSGGFVYMSKDNLLSDLKGGLIQLTLEQLKVIRQWGKNQNPILAVGDIVPLLFARISCSKYAFVGTAKSEYYLRDRKGNWLANTSWLEKQFGSVYFPWEVWLMRSATGVYLRDRLTTQYLVEKGIKAHDLGNPMMDGFKDLSGVVSTDSTSGLTSESGSLKIALLPGSRSPEAFRNWQQILLVVSELIRQLTDINLVFSAAISPGLELDSFQRGLLFNNWRPGFERSSFGQSGFSWTEKTERGLWDQENAHLWLSQNAYQEFLEETDLAIAMAGTATEQFVGLGKPVLTMAGEGPQCTFAFMEAQSRLLGCSIFFCENSAEIVSTIQRLLTSPQLVEAIAENGRARMGSPGSAKRIAAHLKSSLLG